MRRHRGSFAPRQLRCNLGTVPLLENIFPTPCHSLRYRESCRQQFERFKTPFTS